MGKEDEKPNSQLSREHSIGRLIELFSQVSSQVRPDLLDAQSDLELTMGQFRVLALLRNGPLRVRDIAAGLGVGSTVAANLVGRLRAKQLVEQVRDPENRRFVWCRLTALGMREAGSLWNINRQLLESVATSLTNEELQAVSHTLEVLLSALQHRAPEGLPPP